MSATLFALGGAAALGSSIVNAFSQKSANNANLQAVRETNQANLDLYNKQFSDQLKLWNMNNAYNDPSSQISRLRAAGLNPTLNMGSNPTGSAEMASAPTPIPMQAGRVEPVQWNFSDVANSIAMMAGAAKSHQEAIGQQMGNSYINQEKIVGIANQLAQINERLSNVRKGSAEFSYLNAQKDYLMQEYRFNAETFDSRKQSFDLQNQLTQAQQNVLKEQVTNFAADTAYKKSLAALNWVEHSYRGQKLRAEIENLINQAVLSKSTAHLADYQAFSEDLRAKGISISNSQAQEIFPYVKDQAIQALKSGKINIMQQERDYSNPFNYFGRILGGTGSAAIKSFAK